MVISRQQHNRSPIRRTQLVMLITLSGDITLRWLMLGTGAGLRLQNTKEVASIF